MENHKSYTPLKNESSEKRTSKTPKKKGHGAVDTNEYAEIEALLREHVARQAFAPKFFRMPP